MRRVLAAASVMLITAMLAVGSSASTASAAPNFKDIDVQIWTYICDDEVLDKRDNCGEHRMKSRALKVPTAEGKWRWTACQGKEVTVDVELRTKHLPGGKAEIHAGVMFIEGISCNALDIERWDKDEIVITEGERVVKNYVWNNSGSADDSAVVQLIFNDKVKI